MTYSGFLVRFLLIPMIVMGLLLWRDHRRGIVTPAYLRNLPAWVAILVHIFIALVYTTPWDNYLVATNVWYYNPDLVTGIVFGYVPIEEYTFFVVETVLAGLWWWFLSRRLSPPATEFRSNKKLVQVSSIALVVVWVFFTYLFFSDNGSMTYLSITLFWALPAILPQLLFGADILWHFRKLVFWAIMVPRTYLSLMDIVALQDTTWSNSPSQTTGILFFGILPLEVVVFFFITNVLITFGMTLLLANVSEGRVAEIKKQLRELKKKRMFHPQ